MSTNIQVICDLYFEGDRLPTEVLHTHASALMEDLHTLGERNERMADALVSSDAGKAVMTVRGTGAMVDYRPLVCAVTINPMDQTEPPAPSPANPQPPTADEAAAILNRAWQNDADWGTQVWLAMITGSRRGEVCAIRWRHIDLENGVIHMEKAIAQEGSEIWKKDTKTHQDRRIVHCQGTPSRIRRQHRNGEPRDRPSEVMGPRRSQPRPPSNRRALAGHDAGRAIASDRNR